jgi:hypothetical protein
MVYRLILNLFEQPNFFKPNVASQKSDFCPICVTNLLHTPSIKELIIPKNGKTTRLLIHG